MKFMALALVLLLAVGSQATSPSAETPTLQRRACCFIDHFQNLTNEIAKFFTLQVDLFETSYDKMPGKCQEVPGNTVKDLLCHNPLTEVFLQTIYDNITAMKVQLEPSLEELTKVLDSHMAEYKGLLEPIMQDFISNLTANVEDLMTKLNPVMEPLKTTLTENLGETVDALKPIVEVLMPKFSEGMEMVTPYYEEYRQKAITIMTSNDIKATALDIITNIIKLYRDVSCLITS